MKKTLGSILILAVVVAIAVFVIRLNNQEVSEEVLSSQEASAISAFGLIIEDDIISIPDCISSVAPITNGPGCAVTTCGGGVSVGAHSFTNASIALCVSLDEWSYEGWGGDYSQETWGCLANQCLNHSSDDGLFSSIQQVAFDRRSTDMIDDIINIDSVPECIDSISSNHPEAGGCVVYGCGGTLVGEGPLSSNQINNCTGLSYIPADVTEAQLGCLAHECLYYTGINTPINVTTQAFDYIKEFETLTNGSKNPVIFLVESKLRERGYFPGNPDMVFDMMAIQGIRRFQSDNKLQPTGRLDNTTLEYLFFR
jgi:hypothetical protein